MGLERLRDKQSFDISIPTIERVRRLFVEQGIEAAPQPTVSPKYKVAPPDGEQEAHLIVCSQSPEGQARWTLRFSPAPSGTRNS